MKSKNLRRSCHGYDNKVYHFIMTWDIFFTTAIIENYIKMLNKLLRICLQGRLCTKTKNFFSTIQQNWVTRMHNIDILKSLSVKSQNAPTLQTAMNSQPVILFVLFIHKIYF